MTYQEPGTTKKRPKRKMERSRIERSQDLKLRFKNKHTQSVHTVTVIQNLI